MQVFFCEESTTIIMENFLKAGMVPYAHVNEHIWETVRRGAMFGMLPNYESAMQFVEDQNLPFDELYLTTGMNEWVLYDGNWALLEIYPVQSVDTTHVWKKVKSRINTYVANENFLGAIHYAPKRFRMFLTEQNISKIKDKKVARETLLNVRQLTEYDFSVFDSDVLLPWMEQHSHVEADDLKELAKDYPGERLTIYRGEGSKSTPVDEALSWTLNKEKAEFFANRFNSEGIIYEAKVAKENILAYISGNEEEVLVKYDDLEELVELLK